MVTIQFKDVWEMYRIKFVLDKKVVWENFWALKGLNFQVDQGEILGIIGENGSGKSTVLKLMAGMLKPDRGEVCVSGRVSGLLEPGAGFQPELTGKENIYLSASLFGLNKAQIDERHEEIALFAELGKFIHAPVKCYSQGMYVRLAFAIAIHVDPDILLIDDTLAVGDEHFQRKCIQKIFEIKDQGKTIIFVTHDMHMLRRLCKRALFIKEGRIVKDGSTNLVASFYSETVGSRDGVGILKDGSVGIVFNNGKLLVNWQDKMITTGEGIHSIFFAADKWHNSLQAEWHVSIDGDDKLLARGKFYELGIDQVWRLQLVNGNEFILDIQMESQEPFAIREGYLNIMLLNEYKQWFTNIEAGEFPAIKNEDKKWNMLFEGCLPRRCVGVRQELTLSGKIPSFIMEHSDSSGSICVQIANSGYLSNSRVLQYKAEAIGNYAPASSGSFLYFSGRAMLDIPDTDIYLKSKEDQSFLMQGLMRLAFDKGGYRLSYDGLDLTKGQHLSSSVYINGRWYHSGTANWEFKKEAEDRMTARGVFSNFLFSQIWEIRITGKNSFLWKVMMEPLETIHVDQQRLYFMARENYDQWFSEYGSGQFPASFLETNIDMLQRCIPDGDTGLKSSDEGFPEIKVRFSKELGNFIKIFNSDFYSKARVLQIEKVEPENSSEFQKSKQYPCFEIEVTIDKESMVCIGSSSNVLERKNIKIIFDKGAGRIYWDNKELTKGLGIYTSIRSCGRWNDSFSSALWKIRKQDENSLTAYGRWLYLPVEQEWQMRLTPDGVLEWIVKMKVDEQIEVDRLQANIMLSEMYSSWFSNGETGIFKNFKENIDDDWECVRQGEEKDLHIGVSEENHALRLPAILFVSDFLEQGHFFNVVNSDIFHRGRVLQHSKHQKTCLSPGEYIFLNGKIIIDLKS